MLLVTSRTNNCILFDLLLGTFIYKLPASDIREKANLAMATKTETKPLTDSVENTKDQQT